MFVIKHIFLLTSIVSNSVINFKFISLCLCSKSTFHFYSKRRQLKYNYFSINCPLHKKHHLYFLKKNNTAFLVCGYVTIADKFIFFFLSLLLISKFTIAFTLEPKTGIIFFISTVGIIFQILFTKHFFL